MKTGSIFEEISLDNKVPFHIDLFETNIKAAVFRMLGEQGQSSLFAVKVIFHGIEYRKDMCVVVQGIENKLIFGKIKFILSLNNFFCVLQHCKI